MNGVIFGRWPCLFQFASSYPAWQLWYCQAVLLLHLVLIVLVLVQMSKSLTPPGPLHWSSVQELALSYLPVQWEGNWTWHWHGWAHELLHKSVSSWDLRSGFPSCCRLVLVTGPQLGQTLDKPNQRHICRNLLLEEKVFRRNVASQPWVKSDVKIKFYI